MFVRGLNRIHQIEGWKYSRSALFQKTDIQSIKAFFIGAVLSSLVHSGNKGNGTDRPSKRSEPTRYPVSISALEKVLKISDKSAYRYRKLAQKHRYIQMAPNLQQVEGIICRDIQSIKYNNIEQINLKLFGSTKHITAHPKQLRTDKGFVYVQLPNYIYPRVQMNKRKLKVNKS